MTNTDVRVALAMDSIRAYVTEGRTIGVPPDLPPELTGQRAGVFVSLKKHGQLRGCIGTIEPTQDCVAQEIIRNAISAAAQDPRFLPVDESELDLLECSVDVLTPPEECTIEDLDTTRYGVIVESVRRKGLLLPDLEGVDSVEHQVDIAMQKAGIRRDEPLKLYRFEVIRYR